jgi:hypothetical protein
MTMKGGANMDSYDYFFWDFTCATWRQISRAEYQFFADDNSSNVKVAKIER